MDIKLKDGTVLSGVLTEDLAALVKLGVIPLTEYAGSVKSAFEVLYPKLETEQSTLVEGLNFNPKTVTIGNQVWMTENLSFNDGGEGITYNEDNGEYYYTWDAAMRVAKTIPGWHLPSAVEWNNAALACGAIERPCWDSSNPNYNDYAEAQELKAKLGVKLIGYRDSGSFYYLGSYAYFWTATEYFSTDAYSRNFSEDALMYSIYDNKTLNAYSVRLVKDSE